MSKQSASLLVLFGATGDLAQRMLLPSLYDLQRDGLLAPGLRILATSRSGLDDGGFREHAAAAIERQAGAALDPGQLRALL
ncbi:MAG: hypothetical protein KA196_01415, partial [Arenimonas sp.]|nr:hypothetical protein [Arenimonas sp.]